jgi:hypothetical protein
MSIGFIRGERVNKFMKILRPALIVAILCVFAAGAAFADDIHVVFDPQIVSGNFGVVSDPAAIYTVAWESCGSSGIPQAEFGSDQACIALVNETGVGLSHLNFSFTVDAALVGQTIACDSLDDVLSSNDCLSTPGPFTLGQVVSVNFFAGDPIPNNAVFFFGETGVDLADAPTVNITAPEPTSLTLLAAGMGLVGLSLLFVKR